MTLLCSKPRGGPSHHSNKARALPGLDLPSSREACPVPATSPHTSSFTAASGPLCCSSNHQAPRRSPSSLSPAGLWPKATFSVTEPRFPPKDCGSLAAPHPAKPNSPPRRRYNALICFSRKTKRQDEPHPVSSPYFPVSQAAKQTSITGSFTPLPPGSAPQGQGSDSPSLHGHARV